MKQLLGGRPPRRSTLHCSVAPRTKFGPLQSGSTRRHCRHGTEPSRKFSMSNAKKAIPDRGHSRRRHRQGSGAGGPARAGDGREKARRSRAFRPFRFRLLGLLRKARRDDAGGLEGQDRQARRDLFRRGRLARENSRSHFVVGLADQVPPGVRPVRQSAPGAADAGSAVAARQPQARRYRFLGGAREHRGRIFIRRRADVPGYRPRIRHPADGDDPDRRRPHPEIRVRAGAVAAEEASDLGDQIQRHFHHHAVLGRARGGDGEKLSRR